MFSSGKVSSWVSGIAYGVNTLIEYNDQLYFNTVAKTTSDTTTPNLDNDWVFISNLTESSVRTLIYDWAEAGNVGPIPANKLANASSVPVTTWVSGTDYRTNTLVEYNDQLYFNTVAKTTSDTTTPDVDNDWLLIGGLGESSIRNLIYDWAETGNVGPIPTNKLTNASSVPVTTWLLNIDYSIDTIVKYGGNLYRKIANTLPNNSPDTNPTDWKIVDNVGRWIADVLYSQHTIVEYEGIFYYSTTNISSSSGTPDNNDDWDALIPSHIVVEFVQRIGKRQGSELYGVGDAGDINNIESNFGDVNNLSNLNLSGRFFADRIPRSLTGFNFRQISVTSNGTTYPNRLSFFSFNYAMDPTNPALFNNNIRDYEGWNLLIFNESNDDLIINFRLQDRYAGVSSNRNGLFFGITDSEYQLIRNIAGQTTLGDNIKIRFENVLINIPLDVIHIPDNILNISDILIPLSTDVRAYRPDRNQSKQDVLSSLITVDGSFVIDNHFAPTYSNLNISQYGNNNQIPNSSINNGYIENEMVTVAASDSNNILFNIGFKTSSTETNEVDLVSIGNSDNLVARRTLFKLDTNKRLQLISNNIEELDFISLSVSNNIGDIAVHNDVVYIIDNAVNPPTLDTVNLDNGNTITVGPLVSGNWQALTSHNGSLYAIDNTINSLYTINSGTATITIVGSGGSLGTSSYTGLASNGTTLYGIDNNSNSLYTINTTNATTTIVGSVGSLGTGNWTGLVYNNDENRFVVLNDTNNSLYTVDITDGTTSLFGTEGSITNQSLQGVTYYNGFFYVLSPIANGTLYPIRRVRQSLLTLSDNEEITILNDADNNFSFTINRSENEDRDTDTLSFLPYLNGNPLIGQVTDIDIPKSESDFVLQSTANTGIARIHEIGIKEGINISSDELLELHQNTDQIGMGWSSINPIRNHDILGNINVEDIKQGCEDIIPEENQSAATMQQTSEPTPNDQQFVVQREINEIVSGISFTQATSGLPNGEPDDPIELTFLELTTTVTGSFLTLDITFDGDGSDGSIYIGRVNGSVVHSVLVSDTVSGNNFSNIPPNVEKTYFAQLHTDEAEEQDDGSFIWRIIFGSKLQDPVTTGTITFSGTITSPTGETAIGYGWINVFNPGEDGLRFPYRIDTAGNVDRSIIALDKRINRRKTSFVKIDLEPRDIRHYGTTNGRRNVLEDIDIVYRNVTHLSNVNAIDVVEDRSKALYIPFTSNNPANWQWGGGDNITNNHLGLQFVAADPSNPNDITHFAFVRNYSVSPYSRGRILGIYIL